MAEKEKETKQPEIKADAKAEPEAQPLTEAQQTAEEEAVTEKAKELIEQKDKEEITLKPANADVIEKEDAPSSAMDSWKPRTYAGRLLKMGKISDIEQLFDQGHRILEETITETLIPNLESDLLMIGQSKGKFGGGARRVFRQTQKKTMEGNKPSFATYAVVGNRNGIVGVGYGKARETVPAREKALRNAKISVIKIRRGCGSWQCGCKQPHSIPFAVKGKVGSVEIELIPAPKGKGLVVERECQKILAMAGIEDIWSRTKGKTKSKINLIMACDKALKNLVTTKIHPHHIKTLGIAEGQIGEAINE